MPSPIESSYKRTMSLTVPPLKKSRSLPLTNFIKPQTPQDLLTEHARLIETIRILDHVPASLAHQADFVKSLEGKLELAKWRLEKKSDLVTPPKRVQSLRRKESSRSVGSTRESLGWRLMSKVTGKKGGMSDEDLSEDSSLREHVLCQGLEEELRQAKALHTQLLDADVRHTSLRADLDRFYATALLPAELELPQKEDLEERMKLAQTAYDRVHEVFNEEVHALESLTKAGRVLIDCEYKLQEAVEYCTFGLLGRGSMINTLERNALDGVHALASVVQAHIQQAQHVSPAVARFTPLTITQGCSTHRQQNNMPEDQLASLGIDERLNAAATEMQLLHVQLRKEREAALRRVDDIGQHLMQASLALVWNRRNLDGYRKENFEGYMLKKQSELEEAQARKQVEDEKDKQNWVFVYDQKLGFLNPKDERDQHLPLQSLPPPSPEPAQKDQLHQLYQAAFPSTPQTDQTFPLTPISPANFPMLVGTAITPPTPTQQPFRFRPQAGDESSNTLTIPNQPQVMVSLPHIQTEQITKMKRTSTSPVVSATFLDVKFDFEITLERMDPPPAYS